MKFEEKEGTECGSTGAELHSPAADGGAMAPRIISTAGNVVAEKNIDLITSPFVPIGSGGGGGGHISVGNETGKKKRGRPKKYDSEGKLSAAYIRSTAAAAAPPPGFTLSPPSYECGKPSVSGNWKGIPSLGELLTETAGGDFTPHVVTVYTGEDVAAKILTFAQKGSRGVFVLSANGTVSNVTIRQAGSSGGLLTYEGRFEILTLMGSYMVSDNGGIKSRTGGLSVSLASPDGHVLGGCVAGLLKAATPIQIVVGSFVPNGYKVHKKKPYIEPSRASPALPFSSATVTAAVPISQAAPVCNTYPASQFPVKSEGEPNNLSKMEQPNGSVRSPQHRLYPDINLSIAVKEHDAHF